MKMHRSCVLKMKTSDKIPRYKSCFVFSMMSCITHYCASCVFNIMCRPVEFLREKLVLVHKL